MGRHYICLDIGGSKVLGAVLNEKKEIQALAKKKTIPEKGLDTVMEQILKVIDELLGSEDVEKNSVAAIAAGAPGIINDSGKIIFAPNIPWSNFDIKAFIQKRYNVPFFIGNDVNVGTMGEWKFGAGKGMDDVIGVFIGTGIGGGLVINGKLHTGRGFAAGEIGHIVLNPEGPYCGCGARGCLEAYASKIAITNELRNQLGRGKKSIISDQFEKGSGTIKSSALKKAIKEKDLLVTEVIDRAVYYLAAGMASVLNVLNPQMLILGGGVMEALGSYIMPQFKEKLVRFTMPSVYEKTKIVEAELGDHAILYGAMALIEEKLSDENSF